MANKLYAAAHASERPLPKVDRKKRASQPSQDRWKRLMQARDCKSLWMAINWNGTFSTALDEIVKPSDEAFAEHFSTLLNPSTPTANQQIPNSGIYIHVLDDPIDVEKSIKRLKPNKAAGLDGLQSIGPIVTCRLYTPLHYRIGGGRVRRQRFTWSTLTAGSLYQAACDRAYHGVIAIGHW